MKKGDQSEFMTAAEDMKAKLGPSLCYAKWKQVSLHLPTGLNNSCYHPPLHKIPLDSLRNPSALHNTEHKKQQRKLMLEGERPKECSYCWAIEDAGNLSDRHYRSGEPWAQMDATDIDWQADVIPSYVEVNFNHACNLRCSYCSPQFSSSWAKETQDKGAFPTMPPHNAPDHFTGDRRPVPNRDHNPYVDAFWEWWPELYPKLEHFRMTGGEPLMDRNTYRVFEYVLTLPKPDLHLNVTSNFSVEQHLFTKYIDYVKKMCSGNYLEHFMQYVSVDSMGVHAEYIRDGLKMHRLVGYVQHYLDTVKYKNSLTFIITMNNLSVIRIKELLDWILFLRRQYNQDYNKIWFDTPLLRQPAWQSLQILPESYAQKLDDVADWMEEHQGYKHGFKDFEIQRMRRTIAWMREGQQLDREYIKQQKRNFFLFFNEHDKRRGTNFLQTFPEMESWWLECRYHAQQ